MSGTAWKWPSPRHLVSPAVLLAALALGSYSFRYADQLAKKGEQSLVESTQVLGDQTRERVDNFIIDSDRSLFDAVDLGHLSDFQRRWAEIVRQSPVVEAALVLDEHFQIVPSGYVSRRNVSDAEAFRGLFMTKILPDLPLADLPRDFHRHWHHEYNGRDYLISYIKRAHNGHHFYIVLKISLEFLTTRFLPDELATLEGKVLLCVLDAHRNVVYGRPVGQPGKFLYEKAFPTTLYNWRLQMAPPNAALLQREGRTQRRFEYAIIALMLAITFAGVALLERAIGKERRLNELKSDFISNVSHELKTPLSLIRMFGELLALGKLKSPDKAKEYAEIITRESERLGRLIDNVLDFSRIERGRAAYDFQMGRLDTVVERSLDVYRHRLEREGFRLTTKIDPELPEALIDESAMTLLLLNLLENAVKYGKGEISVYLTLVSGRLRLVVGDQGPGIPLDEHQRIFERFYRTHGARGTAVRGSGIGLSLVKHIAEAHGGHVTVDSEPGKGAAFIVDIPLPPNAAPTRVKAA